MNWEKFTWLLLDNADKYFLIAGPAFLIFYIFFRKNTGLFHGILKETLGHHNDVVRLQLFFSGQISELGDAGCIHLDLGFGAIFIFSDNLHAFLIGDRGKTARRGNSTNQRSLP